MWPESKRRRAAVRWTSSADDGDAAEAVADLDRWLVRQEPGMPDWEDLLGRVRDGLLGLSLEPALMSDPQARAIFLDLAASHDAEALDAALDALLARADALAATRAETVPGPQRALPTEPGRQAPARGLFRI